MPTLRNLKISEVSFCKKGMNQHARVALFKSADRPEGPQAIFKATFEEALGAQLVSQRVQNAFYGCFDNLWSRNDAFRTAMTDEIAEGGDGSVAAAAWVDSIKALADNAVAAAKENGGQPTDAELSGAVDKAVAIYLSKQEHEDMSITTKAALLAAVAKFDPQKSTVAEAQAITKAATDLNLEDELPPAGPLAKAAPVQDPTLVRKVAVLEMPADVRKHYDGLDTAGQDAFVAKTAAERAEIVEKANATDPVVHKCADGTEIRKSDGALALMMAKRFDAQDERINALSSVSKATTLEKSAAGFPNVAKSVAVDMLKSAEAVGEDSDAGKAIMKSLRAMNGARAGVFKSLGTTEEVSDGTEASVAKAVGDFNGKVSEISKRDNVGRSVAMTKARAEHPDLFQAAYPQPEEVEGE